MYEIYIRQAVFSQASKYVILVSTNQQTKRTDVCHLYTSAPEFPNPIQIEELSDLTIKACVATIDRKLTLIGKAAIKADQFKQNEVAYQGVCEFIQDVEGKVVCSGRCNIFIKKIFKEVEVPEKSVQKLQKQEDAFDQSFQLKSQEQQQSNSTEQCQIRILIHCGCDFFLNSGFKVCLQWGSQKKQTKLVEDRIHPVWGEAICLTGYEKKQIELSVVDQHKNKLEWLKINPSKIRIMFPYHLRLQFRQECMGTFPYIFMSMIRQDIPKRSIIERQVKLRIRYIGNSYSRQKHYLLIYPKSMSEKSEGRLPTFLEISLKNRVSFDSINQLIQSDEKYQWNHWNLFIPINPNTYQSTITFLKSIMTSSLVCVYCIFDEIKNLFLHNLWSQVNIIQQRNAFEKSLKSIYYKQEVVLIGKSVELSNANTTELDSESGAISLQEKWKILSNNYTLRNQMIEKSLENISRYKEMIRQKGEVLIDLKKTLTEVKKIYAIMSEKQRSTLQNNPSKKIHKIKQNYMNFPMIQITSSLYQKQQELERRKQVNDELRMRMNTLQYFSQENNDLDEQIVANATTLLEQQNKIKKMMKMREVIPKQLEIIKKLEKLFQKRQIDKSINELLKKQTEKLNEIKKRKRENLQNVYQIIKDHNKKPKTLPQQIQLAEEQLLKLNKMYVQLINQN